MTVIEAIEAIERIRPGTVRIPYSVVGKDNTIKINAEYADFNWTCSDITTVDNVHFEGNVLSLSRNQNLSNLNGMVFNGDRFYCHNSGISAQSKRYIMALIRKDTDDS